MLARSKRASTPSPSRNTRNWSGSHALRNGRNHNMLPRIGTGSSPSSSSRNTSNIGTTNATILDVGVCSVQGRRPYQEDEYSVRPNLGNSKTHLYAIYDGHAGGQCSKMISTILPDNLARDTSFHTDMVTALQKAYYSSNDEFLKIAERLKLHDGSTGITSVIRDLKLTIANVGDCRAVLIRNGTAKQLTIDHKPTDPEEQKRIASYGGSVVYCMGVARVNGVLAVSRAFGNRSIRHVIRPDPDIFCINLMDGDDYFIQASDGMWDVLHNKDVLEISRKFSNEGSQRIAEELVSRALSRGTSDNTTAVVLDLKSYISDQLMMMNKNNDKGEFKNNITRSNSSNSDGSESSMKAKEANEVNNHNNNNNNNNKSNGSLVDSPIIPPLNSSPVAVAAKHLNHMKISEESKRVGGSMSMISSPLISGKRLNRNSNSNGSSNNGGGGLGSRLLEEASKLFGKPSINTSSGGGGDNGNGNGGGDEPPAPMLSPIQTQRKRSGRSMNNSNAYNNYNDNSNGSRSSPITVSNGFIRPRTSDRDRDASGSALSGPR